MWANGNQSTQWWPMNYGYQYPPQDSSADWATRAALWAQQRQAQEDMNKQHQEYYASTQKHPITEPPLPDTDPPPPPGESIVIPPKPEHEVDNLESVAMDDESLDTTTPEQGIAVTRLDYNHGQPVPLPEVGPPPPIPGMQTFDHNHGFTPASSAQSYGHVPAQRFDYGHQSHQPSSNPPASSHWYDYDHDDRHHKDFEPERHHSRVSRNNEPVAPHGFDYSTLSDVKKKALPLWIREGLEKMEREKQKKQEQELKKSLNSSTSSLSTIAGYDHGNVHSPVPSPTRVESDEEPIKTEQVKKQEIHHSKDKKTSKRHWSPKKSLKSDSSDEEVDNKSESEKQQEMLVKMRTMLTEILLTVTNDELHNIAKESYSEALTAENKQLRNSGGLVVLKNPGALGVGDYGSDSESSDEETPEPEERHHAPSELPEKPKQSISPLRDQHEYKSSSQSRSSSPRHGTPSDVSDRESERSSSSKKKKHRSKHKRKDRSRSTSRSKHRSRRSKSRSKSPKKRKNRKREKSRSPSDSRKSKRHSRSSSRSPRRHRKHSESGSRSPSSRKHSRRKRSESDSPRRKRSHRSRSSSSDRHREGKRGRKRRSRSRSRSSTPRHRRH
ncbi:arginine/serine-rich protein PNISR isoform X2 [Exaiptasia diaphana]|uniref:Arginine/serine-rich protein PNISR n=1 Tax=Exaiptasia diaphana TaxID=2652724 RepID=A0A913Y4V8_EXADI|nr:arginine/serine-rich protein PNISR isoform X2 [Exaiptasia diaphana]